MSAFGDMPHRPRGGRLTMADLVHGMRVRHVEWNATGTVYKTGGWARILFDPPARGGLDIGPNGPVRPSDLEILEGPE